MKRNLNYLLFLMPQTLLAINIHNVQITPIATSTINISLTTEAQELYYFDSWNYSITGNCIIVNAYFIEGFGSTISYLNNNFAIALPIPQQYIIIVRILYTDAAHTYKLIKDSERILYRHVIRKP